MDLNTRQRLPNCPRLFPDSKVVRGKISSAQSSDSRATFISSNCVTNTPSARLQQRNRCVIKAAKYLAMSEAIWIVQGPHHEWRSADLHVELFGSR